MTIKPGTRWEELTPKQKEEIIRKPVKESDAAIWFFGIAGFVIAIGTLFGAFYLYTH
jgi:hypothetical protein